MPKHRADLAQPQAWRDEHGVRSEGWLHPSAEHRSLHVCNCCGGYYRLDASLGPVRIDIDAFRAARERLRRELA